MGDQKRTEKGELTVYCGLATLAAAEAAKYTARDFTWNLAQRHVGSEVVRLGVGWKTEFKVDNGESKREIWPDLRLGI